MIFWETSCFEVYGSKGSQNGQGNEVLKVLLKVIVWFFLHKITAVLILKINKIIFSQKVFGSKVARNVPQIRFLRFFAWSYNSTNV